MKKDSKNDMDHYAIYFEHQRILSSKRYIYHKYITISSSFYFTVLTKNQTFPFIDISTIDLSTNQSFDSPPSDQTYCILLIIFRCHFLSKFIPLSLGSTLFKFLKNKNINLVSEVSRCNLFEPLCAAYRRDSSTINRPYKSRSRLRERINNQAIRFCSHATCRKSIVHHRRRFFFCPSAQLRSIVRSPRRR